MCFGFFSYLVLSHSPSGYTVSCVHIGIFKQKRGDDTNNNNTYFLLCTNTECTDCETNIMIFVERLFETTKKRQQTLTLKIKMELFVFFSIRMYSVSPQLNHIAFTEIMKLKRTRKKTHSSKTKQKYENVYYLSASYNFHTHKHKYVRTPEKYKRKKWLFSFCGNFLPLVFTSN